ncbi:MAG TPA: DUF2085 domain-containing protein [Pyrinomonadaceae bacterium]|jgi:uncharacterized membrane protein
MRADVSEYVPQYARGEVASSRVWLAWGVVVTSAFVFVGLTLFAPLGRVRAGVWSSVVYAAFGMICHQMPERSFHVEGHPLAVCARCFGVYAGFAASVLVYPLMRSLQRTDVPSRVWLLAAVLPLAVDFTLGFTGLWENTHASRFATGALAGAASVFYVMPGAIELSHIHRRRLFADAATDKQRRRVS